MIKIDTHNSFDLRYLSITDIIRGDPGFFLGGGAVVSCSTSTPINHIVFLFLQNTSCIRKPQVISGGGGGGAHPLHPPPRSAPDYYRLKSNRIHNFNYRVSLIWHGTLNPRSLRQLSLFCCYILKQDYIITSYPLTL